MTSRTQSGIVADLNFGENLFLDAIAFAQTRDGHRLMVRVVGPGMGYGGITPGSNHVWKRVHAGETSFIEIYDRESEVVEAPFGSCLGRFVLSGLIRRMDEPDLLLVDRQQGSEQITVRMGDIRSELPKLGNLADRFMSQRERGLRVLLANRGDVDKGEDPRSSLHWAPGDFWKSAQTLQEASCIVQQYVEAFGLNRGRWVGGEVRDRQGSLVGWITQTGMVRRPQGGILEGAQDNLAHYNFISASDFHEMAIAVAEAQANDETSIARERSSV